jgi:hypothetical protein
MVINTKTPKIYSLAQHSPQLHILLNRIIAVFLFLNPHHQILQYIWNQ